MVAMVMAIVLVVMMAMAMVLLVMAMATMSRIFDRGSFSAQFLALGVLQPDTVLQPDFGGPYRSPNINRCLGILQPEQLFLFSLELFASCVAYCTHAVICNR